MSLEAMIDDFSYLTDWEDRYRYIIELGRSLPAFPESQKTDSNKVQGCVSQVWLLSHEDAGPPVILSFVGDSDAHIVRGLIAILFELYSGKSPDEILSIDTGEFFKQLELTEHLTPQRSNGLFSMVGRIQKFAEQACRHRSVSGR